MMDGTPRYCELCAKKGVQKALRIFQFSFDEAVYMCPSKDCTYPMGLDDKETLPVFVNRHISDIPQKSRNLQLKSRSTSCSSSRSDSPVLPQNNGHPLKPSKFIPKPTALVASVAQKLSSNELQTNGNSVANALPKFDSVVLAGRHQATKRVHPSNTRSPPHSPERKLPKTSYVPQFAPTTASVKSVSKRLDFDEVLPNGARSSTPSTLSGKSSASSLPSGPQNEVSCIPDYLGANSASDVNVSPIPSVPFIDLSALSELPDIFAEKPNPVKSPKRASHNKKNGQADNATNEFAPISLQDMFSSPPKPVRITDTKTTKLEPEPVKKPNSLPRKKSTVPAKPTPTNNALNSQDETPKVSSQSLPEKAESLDPPKTPTKKPESLKQAIKSFCHMQWSNKDALCWLDVSMNLLVHSRLFHSIVKTRPKASCSVVKQLLDNYTKAQSLLKQALEFKRCQLIGQTRAVVLETSVGMVHVKTGGGDATDILPTDQTPETLVVKTSLSPLLSTSKARPRRRSSSVTNSTGTGENADEKKMEVTTQQLQTRSDQLSDAAKDVLVNAREAVWRFLHPKLKCQKGENDSPVFALPLLLGEDPVLKKRLTNDFQWRMTCTECGHKHVDKVSKVLLTFPTVPVDFSMRAPYFLRSCFRCGVSGQRLTMHRDTDYPELLVAHFLDGVHKPPARYDFFQHGHVYSVTGVVQYRHNPDHFVAWIRHPRLELWMELDDLKHQIARYSDKPPSFPPSQVHMIMWSRKSTDSSPADNLLLYMSPPKNLPRPQAKGRGNARKPTAKSPLRSALRSPQKKAQDKARKGELSTTKTGLVYKGKPTDQEANTNGVVEAPKPKRAPRKLSKIPDHLEPQDMVKTLLKKFSVENFRKDPVFDSTGQKQQFAGYIPKTIPKQIEVEAETKVARQKNAKVCFKSRTPTPELHIIKGALGGQKKSKGYLSRVRKQLEKLDAERNLPNGVTVQGKKKQTVANGQSNDVRSNGLPYNHQNKTVANSNGITSSSENGDALMAFSNGMPEIMDGQIVNSNGTSHILNGQSPSMDSTGTSDSMNSERAMSDSNGVADSQGMQEVLGDLCKNLDIPDLNVDQMNTGVGFSMDDIDIFFDDANSQASSQEADTAIDQFDLDMFL